eukprot:15345612-Ditylum_brightwellii.AAC.1
MIGVHAAIDEQSSSEWTYLKKKTKKLRQALDACPAKLQETYTLYTIMLLPSIAYSLTATSLDNDQFQHSENLFMYTLFQKMKLSKSYPKALIYCNKKFLGSVFFYLKSLQVSTRTTYLIKHLHQQ